MCCSKWSLEWMHIVWYGYGHVKDPWEWQVIPYPGWVSEGWQRLPLVHVQMLTECTENVYCNFLAPDIYGKTALLPSLCLLWSAKPASLFSWMQQPFFPIQLYIILWASRVPCLLHQRVQFTQSQLFCPYVSVFVFASFHHCPSKSIPGAVQKAPLYTVSWRTTHWGLYCPEQQESWAVPDGGWSGCFSRRLLQVLCPDC